MPTNIVNSSHRIKLRGSSSNSTESLTEACEYDPDLVQIRGKDVDISRSTNQFKLRHVAWIYPEYRCCICSGSG
jgi:hypothetical protein